MVLTSLLCLTANSKNFCESFRNINHKMLFYSNPKLIVLFIDSEYWELKHENKTDIKFLFDNQTSLNTSQLLSKGYKFVVQDRSDLRKGMAFYDVLDKY